MPPTGVALVAGQSPVKSIISSPWSKAERPGSVLTYSRCVAPTTSKKRGESVLDGLRAELNAKRGPNY